MHEDNRNVCGSPGDDVVRLPTIRGYTFVMTFKKEKNYDVLE